MRKWIDLFEEPDLYVYHVTDTDHLNDIAKNGLIPQSPGPDGWPEYDEDADEDEGLIELDAEAFEARTFVWEDYQLARQWASGHSGEIVILRMPYDVASWEHGWTDFRYLYTTESISSVSIDVETKNGWQKLAK